MNQSCVSKALLAAAAAPSAYLAAVTLAGLPGSRRSARPSGSAQTTFTILIPAHDEADGISEALQSVHDLDYPNDRYSCHVVADNCTDRTVEVVRASGIEAHVRVDPEHIGKGAALNWLFDRLAERGDLGDVIVIVDADTSLDSQFLGAMADAFADGAEAAQGRYLVRNPAATATTSFRYAALACRHHLRPLGRRRLGCSCGLYGNGMAFRRGLLSGRRWSNHLVEDAEFQLELLLDGHVVRYVPGAALHAEMPHDRDQSTSQQQRWERGRAELTRRFAPDLARAALTGRPAAIDSLFDLLLPPLSVVAVSYVLGAGASAPIALRGRAGARRVLLVSSLGILTVGLHAIAGLFSVRADRVHYRTLLAAPRTILWKTRLWATTALGRSDVRWQRTRRNAEVAR